MAWQAMLDEIRVMQNHLNYNFSPPILFDEYIHHRHVLLTTEEYLTDDQMLEVLGCANYWGALIRTTYLLFVHRMGCDPSGFWNALILTFTMTGLWPKGDVIYDGSRSQITRLAKRFSRPEWVDVGLRGGDWSNILRMCQEFAAEMDTLKEQDKEQLVVQFSLF